VFRSFPGQIFWKYLEDQHGSSGQAQHLFDHTITACLLQSIPTWLELTSRLNPQPVDGIQIKRTGERGSSLLLAKIGPDTRVKDTLTLRPDGTTDKLEGAMEDNRLIPCGVSWSKRQLIQEDM
jgi:hypothetical protein